MCKNWLAPVMAAVAMSNGWLGLTGIARGGKPPPAPIGVRLSDWTLPRSSDGQAWSLAREGRNAKVVVVVFLGTECPVNNLYLPTLVTLHKKYAPRSVLFAGINSNAQDDNDTINTHARRFALPFVVLKDAGAKVADRFAADRTPVAFVLDASRTVRYRGRIDDRYDKGIQRAQATRHDLEEAIEAVLDGREVARPVTEAAGCLIARPLSEMQKVGGAPVTYSQDVARLIQNHCQECHRPGEAAPFSLLTYQDARAWSAAIREAVAERRMPPWHADPAHGRFRNSRRLSDTDRAMLLAWIDGGCHEGNPNDLPPPRTFVHGWRIGQPDVVFTMPRSQAIPAQAPKAGIPYKFVLVSEPFPEEKWVRAVECRPGAADVVHHITAFLLPPGTDANQWEEKTEKAPLFNVLFTSYEDDYFLAGYGPGEDPMNLPPGQAKRIPKGARIAFELHYTPNGTACSDRSFVGLVYAKEPPRHRVLTGSVLQPLLLIPPGVADHCVVASKTFNRPATLLSLCPHMHLRAKSAVFQLIRPDGSRQILLDVPHYDFNWQTDYFLAEPLRLDKGAKLEFIVHYDNSAANPNNPDPTKYVSWGEQNWNEMMIGFFEYYFDDE
jgi:thiol-disulfide isomerase/thioredoxin